MVVSILNNKLYIAGFQAVIQSSTVLELYRQLELKWMDNSIILQQLIAILIIVTSNSMLS